MPACGAGPSFCARVAHPEDRKMVKTSTKTSCRKEGTNTARMLAHAQRGGHGSDTPADGAAIATCQAMPSSARTAARYPDGAAADIPVWSSFGLGWLNHAWLKRGMGSVPQLGTRLRLGPPSRWAVVRSRVGRTRATLVAALGRAAVIAPPPAASLAVAVQAAGLGLLLRRGCVRSRLS